jgi:thioesterase domain-containing protein
VKIGAPPPPTPVPLTRSGSRTPIFGVHNGAGTAFPYVPLARKLGPDQPFFAFQQFEFDRRQLFASIEAMAGAYVDAVRMLRPNGPYVFAGMCSTGAYVAYEMAQRMLALDEEVQLVILFDPMNSEVARECSRSRVLVDQAVDVADRMSGRPDADAHASGLRTELAELVSALGLAPELLQLPPRRLGQFLEMFASNHKATLSYSPRPYPGRASLFVPRLSTGDDRLLSETEWEALIATLEIHPVPTHRGELFTDPEMVADVAAVLQAVLR